MCKETIELKIKKEQNQIKQKQMKQNLKIEVIANSF